MVEVPILVRLLRLGYSFFVEGSQRFRLHYYERCKQCTFSVSSYTKETYFGRSQDTSKSHTSFPQSNHISNSLQIINDRIVANESHFSKVSGFGLAFFNEHFRSKDYDIFDSTLGKLVPSCDKALSSSINSRPLDGLRLSQSVSSKTENLLRNASHVLGTAEHFFVCSCSFTEGLLSSS